MVPHSRRFVCILLAGGLIGQAGCSGKPAVDSGNVEATVRGTIKVDGVPPKTGEILFDSANLGRTGEKRIATVREGTYTIKTLTGRNIVKLTGDLAKRKPLLQQQTQSFEVKEGENEFNMEFSAH